MQNFDEFYHDQSISLNRLGLVCAIIFSTAFYPLDQDYFGDALAAIAMNIRFFVVAPIFGLALALSFYKNQPRLYLHIATIGFLVATVCVTMTIAISDRQDLFVAFIMLCQNIFLFTFVVYLPVPHSLVLLAIAITAPLVIFLVLTGKPVYEPIFLATELAGIGALSLVWALRRHKNSRQSFLTKLKLENDNAVRRRWNNAFRTSIKGQISSYMSAISENLDQLDKLAPSDKYLGRARESFENVQLLENQLLLNRSFFSTETNLTGQTFDLSALLLEIKKEFGKQGERIAIDVLPSELYVKADSTLIRRAIYNLIENALRHRKPDSVVSLKLDEYGKLAIINEGEPLPSSLDDMQIAGVQGDQHSGKYGLGLHICRSICEAHKIRMGYAHSQGKTEFSMQFSLHNAETLDKEIRVG